MGKENMIYTYNGTLALNKKEIPQYVMWVNVENTFLKVGTNDHLRSPELRVFFLEHIMWTLFTGYV